MARVLVKTQPWGVLWTKDSDRAVKIPLAGEPASINTTVYSSSTGSGTVTAFESNANGELPGYIEEGGPLTLTVNGVGLEVHAVHGNLWTRLPVNVESYTGSAQQKLESAIAAAVAKTTATSIGVLTAPPGSSYTITAPLVANARIGLDMRGVRLTTSGGTFAALTVGPSDPASTAQGAGQRPMVLYPPEVVNGVTDLVGNTAGFTLRSMIECRVVDAMSRGFPVGFDMIDNCYGATWINPHARASLHRIGMRVRGTVGTNAGAGNDITIINPWVGGRDAGIWIDPRASAIHIVKGQVNAGEGLAAADDNAGAICWGKRLDDATDVAACGQIDLDCVSLEGTQRAWGLRGFAFAHVLTDGLVVRANIAGKPMIGVLKSPDGTAEMRKTEVYDKFTNAKLVSFSFPQGSSFFDESGTATAATVGTASDGSGGTTYPAGIAMAAHAGLRQGRVSDRPVAQAGSSSGRLLIDGRPLLRSAVAVPRPNLVAHFRADSLAASLADGTAVGTWADQSGNDRDLTQATVGLRPIFRENVVNNWPAVEFDGTDDTLAAAAFTLNQPTFVFFVAKYAAANANGTIIDGNASNTMRIYRTTTTQLASYAGNSGPTMNANPETTWRQYGVLFNGASSEARWAGGNLATGNVGASNAGGIRLGGDGTAAYFQGHIAEILIYDAALTAPNRRAVEDYLRAKYEVA